MKRPPYISQMELINTPNENISCPRNTSPSSMKADFVMPNMRSTKKPIRGQKMTDGQRWNAIKYTEVSGDRSRSSNILFVRTDVVKEQK